MRRRAFIAALSSTAVWPVVARAQQASKVPTIGFLGAGSPSAWTQWTAAFVQRLRELGWVEGRTVKIDYRWAGGRSELYGQIATEFVGLKVDVIVTGGAEAVIATKQTTSIVPIVFAVAADPLGTGLVASLARPGGNVTGLSVLFTDLAGKRLEYFREVVPNVHRLAIMANVASPSAALEMREVQAIARTVGLELTASEIRRPEDVACL
jgi:ABC-type uncharacterized transport system substrate-binding protein